MDGTFEHFPEDATCPICGTNKNAECYLVPIKGTGDGKICEKQPTHVECVMANLQYKKEIGVMYLTI